MTASSIDLFLWGASAMAGLVIGLHFCRFYRDTKDRFFLMFGFAFFLLAIDRVVLAFLRTPMGEQSHFIYLLRLAAFVLIIVAIFDKNRRPSGDDGR